MYVYTILSAVPHVEVPDVLNGVAGINCGVEVGVGFVHSYYRVSNTSLACYINTKFNLGLKLPTVGMVGNRR